MVEAGYTRIAYAEHGIGQPYGNGHPGYPGGIKRDRIGLFLSPNATAAAADRAVYPNAAYAIIGDPVLDGMGAVPPDQPSSPVAISFHWDCAVVPETRMTFRYWADAVLALSKEVPLLGHAHPKALLGLKNFYRKAGIPFEPDWRKVLATARAYICDNSSTLYEFASTGRPVVVLNAPTYRRNKEFGLRFWAASKVGLNVERPVALTETVLCALEDPPGAQADREAALDLAYGFRSGAAQRGAAAIMDWLT